MKTKRKYEVFSTTADVGIDIKGDRFEEFYSNAIKGLNLLIFGFDFNKSNRQIPLSYPFKFKGDSSENVLVNLLSEVIFLVYSKNKITIGLQIKKVNDTSLDADLFTLKSTVEPVIEIKSVTYHNLKIIEKKGVKSTKIIFDI